jgi:hypothetical protein
MYEFDTQTANIRYDFHIKRCWVRLYLQLFVEGLMFYLRYLCLFAHSGVQQILLSIMFICFITHVPRLYYIYHVVQGAV